MTTRAALLRCHAVEFGYLHDPGSGMPIRSYGRHLVRTTQGFPQGVVAVALPTRLASHVSALPYLVAAEHGAGGALLISPSYERTGSGLTGAWVTVQRVRLNPLADAAHLPGDAVQSSSLIIRWCDYAAHAPHLGGTIARLSAGPVSAFEPDASRIDRPLLPVVVSNMTPRMDERTEIAARAIVGAVILGARLRLDQRWCATETEFVDALLCALGRLPEVLRAHVSAAAGLSCADRGFQIVWSLEDLGLDPGSAMARRLIELGAAPSLDRPEQDAPDLLADDGRFAADYGLVSATFDRPEFHAHVRRHVRERFDSATKDRRSADSPELSLARHVDEGDLGPAEAERLLSDLQRPRIGSAACHSLAAMLNGIASTECAVEDIAAAVELCDLADPVGEDPRINRVRDLAGQLISARFAETVVLPDNLLAAAMQRQALAGIIAREYASGNERAVEPLKRTLAALAKRDRHLFRRIAARVLPRDHRVLSVWNGGEAADYCLAGALFDAVAAPRWVDASVMETVSETLVAEGKWDLVREALLTAANAVSRGENGALPQGEALASRLRLVSAIARSMERNLAQPHPAPRRLATG